MTSTTTTTPDRATRQSRERHVPVSTDRRFVMIGNTVKILADYDRLKGHYAKVISPDFGGCQVLVKMISGGDPERHICFLSREVQHSPSGGGLRYCETGREDIFLSGRAAELAGYAAITKSEVTRAALLRRKNRLMNICRGVDRVRYTYNVRAWAVLGCNFCTAIVPYVAAESGVGA